MVDKLTCPSCGGTIEVDVKSEIISCSSCGKSFVNPYYEPDEQKAEEPVQEEQAQVVDEPANEEVQVTENAVAEEPVQEQAIPEPQQAEPVQVQQVAPQAEVQARVTTEPQTSENKQSGKKIVKPDKKKVRSLVKASICLVLSILLFAFSFCPIIGARHYNNLKGDSGADYVAYMFYTGRHWDEESRSDLKKIEKLEDEKYDLEEDAEDIDESYTVTTTGKHNYSSSYVNYDHKYNKLVREYELSMDGNITKLEIAQITFVGILSLIYILFTGGMMILSAIAFVISLMNILKNEDKKFFFEKYHYLFAIGMFLSLGVFFGIYMIYGDMLWLYGCVSGVFIARLFFDCLAFALIIAEKAVEIVKNKTKVRDWAFKALSVALVIIAIGCCFAPAFYTKEVVEGDENDIVIREKYSAYIMGEGAITEDEYEEEYEDWDSDDYLEEIEENMVGGSFAEALRYIALDKQAEKAGSYSTGYFFIILAILAFGGLVCAQLFDGKKANLAKNILAIIAIAFLFAAFVSAIALVASCNSYISDFDYDDFDFKVVLDGGIVCAFIFSICALLVEILPKKFLPKQLEEEVDEDILLEEELILIEE